MSTSKLIWLLFVVLGLVALVSGSESEPSLRGAAEKAEEGEAAEREFWASIRADMAQRAKELEGVEPPKIKDLLAGANLDDEDEEHRDLQWNSNRPSSLGQLLSSDSRLTALYSLVEYCGITNAFTNQRNSLTVFAPRDHAFSMLDPDTVQSLIQSREICNILLYHVIQGQLSTNSRSWRLGGPWGTLHGNTITTETIMTGGGRRIDQVNGYSRLEQANIQASNGIIHVIRQVLLPNPLPAPMPAPVTP
jgi:uncharacterized surface protein with fasciclin (FAS1) repeats